MEAGGALAEIGHLVLQAETRIGRHPDTGRRRGLREGRGRDWRGGGIGGRIGWRDGTLSDLRANRLAHRLAGGFSEVYRRRGSGRLLLCLARGLGMGRRWS